MGIGGEVSDDELQADWVMTHEMVHLAFPRVDENQHWIEEGLATYVEPVARAQIGDLSADYLWQETIEGMPKGLPQSGDQGLDNTATWGRTYWGGAMFCLLADVQIRERTHNHYGLQDAVRGILAAGGNINSRWPLDKAFAAADKAVGVPVLEDLYAAMKDKPVDPDLPALWKKLGVALAGWQGRVRRQRAGCGDTQGHHRSGYAVSLRQLRSSTRLSPSSRPRCSRAAPRWTGWRTATDQSSLW